MFPQASALFAYGTLEFAPVIEALLGRRPAAEPAWLDGWARVGVRDASYPAIVERPGARTAGTLYRSIAPVTFASLDRFEGPLYERRIVQVRTAQQPRCRCFAYVVPRARARALTGAPWRAEHFAAEALDALLEHGRRFRGTVGRWG